MMLKLNELRIENDDYVMKTCLINPRYIVSIQSGQLTKKGPHLIGQERERELRMVSLVGGGAIFTDETVEEIEALLKK